MKRDYQSKQKHIHQVDDKASADQQKFVTVKGSKPNI